MEPTIQLIHLMLRAEREEEAQRRLHMTPTDNLVEEKPIYSPKRDNHIKRNFNSPCRQQWCECS